MRVCELEAECAMRRTIFGFSLVADVETIAGVVGTGHIQTSDKQKPEPFVRRSPPSSQPPRRTTCDT